MGASNGGLVAFQTILADLPEELPAAVLIVQHRLAEGESRLVELMARHSRLPLVEPDDKDRIVPGHAYLAPAGYHMMVDRGSIALSTDAPIWFARPSIDVLFESVADEYGARAVAVVLTGANQDGAAGADAIRSVGGRVVVEDPESAVSSELPKAALARFRPDAVRPLAGISVLLRQWCNSPRVAVQTRRT
jgi:two-component system chemotaxis response regulator CheB